jgi:prolyl-tRNA editing enzyme YbaK/EbsC (Cys-tRNA(Pro) deacylase)
MTSPAPLDLAEVLRGHGLEAEIVSPGVPMPTVEAAAAAMGCPPERIFKSIVFQAADRRCVLVIACGLARVDVSKVQQLSGLTKLRLARPDVVLAVTGYPAGGTPPVGHREPIPVIVDVQVVAQEWGWAGGGRSERLLKILSADIVRLGAARVAEVTTST